MADKNINIDDDLQALADNEDIEEFTSEELDLINLGIHIDPYAKAWYARHDALIFTTKGNLRKAFVEWYLDNFTEWKDLTVVEDIEVHHLEDYNQELVANKISELSELEPEENEDGVVGQYIDKLAKVRKENQELTKANQELESKVTYHRLNSRILTALIPVFVKEGLEVTLEDREVRRIKKIYSEGE